MDRKLVKKSQDDIGQGFREGGKPEEIMALGELVENLEELNRWQNKLLLEAKKRIQGLLEK